MNSDTTVKNKRSFGKRCNRGAFMLLALALATVLLLVFGGIEASRIEDTAETVINAYNAGRSTAPEAPDERPYYYQFDVTYVNINCLRVRATGVNSTDVYELKRSGFTWKVVSMGYSAGGYYYD